MKRLVLLTGVIWLMLGCGKVNPRPAMADVNDIVRGRSGYSVDWVEDPAEFEKRRESVSILLQEPLTTETAVQIGILNNADGLTGVRDDEETDPEKRYKLFANMQDHAMQARHNKVRYPHITPEQVAQAYEVFGHYLDTSPDGIYWTRKPRRFHDSVSDYMMVTRDYRNHRWWLNDRLPDAKGGLLTIGLRSDRD